MGRRVVQRLTGRPQSLASDHLQIQNVTHKSLFELVRACSYTSEDENMDDLEYILLGPRVPTTDKAVEQQQLQRIKKYVNGIHRLITTVHPTVDSEELGLRIRDHESSLLAQRVILLTAIVLEPEVREFFAKLGGFSLAVTRVAQPLYSALVRTLFTRVDSFVRDVSVTALLFPEEDCWTSTGVAIPLYKRVAEPATAASVEYTNSP